MSMRSWIRNLFARPGTRPIRKAPHRARLALEGLEDRVVPSVSFAPPIFVPTPSPGDGVPQPGWYVPSSVAVGDFDLDGRSDLAVTESYADRVHPRLGNGDGTFALADFYDAGDVPTSVAVADFNGLPIPGLAVTNFLSGTVSVLYGRGTGTFVDRVPFAVGNGPLSVAVGDFNGDGRQDLATANYLSGTVSVLLSNGLGGFQSAVHYAVGNAPGSLAVADFNGDGRQDLATANSASHTVSVLLGTGFGGFQSAVSYAVGIGPGSVAVADFNGDGRQDLATVNGGSANVSVLLGNGNGTFAPAAHHDVGSDPGSLAVGDFNGDGKQDLAVGNIDSRSYRGSVNVLLGNGNGTFQSPAQVSNGSGPAGLAVGDFNGDTRPDLVVTYQGVFYYEGTVSVLLNTTTPTTTAVVTSASSSTYGDSVTFTATVTGDSTPTGSVNFVIDSGAPVAGIAGSTTGTTATWTYTTSTLAAGPHTVEALYVGTGGFTNSSGTLSGGQMVNKANATVVVTPYSVTYDGIPHTATYTITGVNGETGAAVGTVTLNTTHTSAGTYSDSWSFTGAANYNNIASTTIVDVINKASSTTTVTIVGGPFSYSGLAQTPATVTVTGAGGLSLTPTASYANNVNAGTATASYSYAGDANHEASSDSNTFTINKATAAVVVSGYSGGTYDGSAHTRTVTITGVPSDGQLYSTSLTGTNAGSYSQPWSYSNANYLDVGATLAFTIAKADATVVVTPYTVTYDGSPHTATYTITGVNGETGAAVGSVTLSTTHTNAGTYSDSWSFTGAGNYNNIASTTITDTINKATLTITANNDTKVYGTLKTFSITAFTQTGLVNGDAITGVTETSTGAAAAAAVGTYAIVPSAATGTGLGNYDITYLNGTLAVFPPLTVPAGVQTAFEDVDKAISGISIGSGLSGSLTLTLGVSHGTLALGTTTGLTVTGNGTDWVSLFGSTADLNAALTTLVYRGGLNFSGADPLSLTLSNGSFSWNASVAITVVSAAQQATDLQAKVTALQTAGVLNQGQANSLIVKLNLHGNGGDTGKVQAFLNHVAAFLNAGILTQAQADVLLGPGNILLVSVTRR